MDVFDSKILAAFQRVTLRCRLRKLPKWSDSSSTPCWRRIQNTEKAGVLKGRVAILDPIKPNVGVTVFVAIKTAQHQWEWLERFARHVDLIEEVVEFYRMSGDVDYMLRVVVPDIAACDAVYKLLIEVGGSSDVSSTFAMERITYDCLSH